VIEVDLLGDLIIRRSAFFPALALRERIAQYYERKAVRRGASRMSVSMRRFAAKARAGQINAFTKRADRIASRRAAAA
jgi:hypothetical protein